MEFNLKKIPVGVLSSLLDTVAEQPVDIDFTLPDYCPDIEKILRCKLIPKIYNRNLSGGQLQVDGSTVVSVLYIDPSGSLRACEQTVPFNSSFPLKSGAENAVAITSVKCEYVNCRALSRRRLTVHGAFSLYAKVMCRSTVDLFSPDDSDKLEFLTKNQSVSALVSLCQEQFSAGDELQIGNKPSVEVILDSDVKARITDFKIIPDKLMLNGELSVRLLYLSAEAERPQQLDYIIPFSKVIDCESFDSDTVVSADISVMSFDIRLKNDILSENPLVDVDCRLCLTAEGYSQSETEIVLDAFSTEFASSPQLSRVTVPTDVYSLSETVMQKESVGFEENSVVEILDLRCSYCPQNNVLNSDSLSVSSKLNVCILALNSEGQYVYLERSVEFMNEFDLPSSYNRLNFLSVTPLSLSYRIGDNNTIELRCELRFTASLINEDIKNIVRSVNVDEDKKLEPSASSLVLYYADGGESLWEIAKRYNTRLKRIYEENDLDSDILENSAMLMIPTL